MTLNLFQPPPIRKASVEILWDHRCGFILMLSWWLERPWVDGKRETQHFVAKLPLGWGRHRLTRPKIKWAITLWMDERAEQAFSFNPYFHASPDLIEALHQAVDEIPDDDLFQ